MGEFTVKAYVIEDDGVTLREPEVWTFTPDPVVYVTPDAILAEIAEIEAEDAVLDVSWWLSGATLDSGSEPDFDIGMCWCGAYGRLGSVHNAKPSADEPVEECGRYL